MRQRHARGPVVHRVEQRAEKQFLPVAELFDLRRFFGESLDHAHPGDVFLNHGGHRAVEVVHLAPLRLEFAGEEGNERDGGNQRQQCQDSQHRTGRENQRHRQHERHGNVEDQEQAGEQEILETQHVGGRAGDEFARVGLVVVTEGEPLEGVVNGGADVAEGPLNEAIADRAEEDSIAGANQNQGNKQEHTGPQVQRGAPFDVPAQLRDGAAEDLRQ